MSWTIVISRPLTDEVISIPTVTTDIYKQIRESYLCGRFDLHENDIENIVQVGTPNKVYGYFDIDENVRFWHLNLGISYSIMVRSIASALAAEIPSSSTRPVEVLDLLESDSEEHVRVTPVPPSVSVKVETPEK